MNWKYKIKFLKKTRKRLFKKKKLIKSYNIYKLYDSDDKIIKYFNKFIRFFSWNIYK